MIGTIRKHSSWLWWIIAGATIVSFVWWNAAVPSRNSGGGGAATGQFGSVYGKAVTAQEYLDAKNDYYLFSWFHNGFEWPDRAANFSSLDMDQQIYLRIMLLRKAQSLGIYVDDNAAETSAGAMLGSSDLVRAFRVKGAIPVDVFVKQILQPENLTADDFERFARNDLIIQQLVQTMGLAGQLFTPQEAAAAWRRDNEERKAQIVFFSSTNFLSQVPVTAAAVGQFYTNYMADYRLPDRMQVSYVEFNLSNYLAGAEKQIGTSNLDYQVTEIFAQDGMDAVPGAKTPDEARAMIRDFLIRKRALSDAGQDANDFANAAFGISPQGPAGLAAAAKQKGFTVKILAPFSEQYGPSEFVAPDSFTKAAFALTPDDPLTEPVQGTYAYYVMALVNTFPSEIPSLDEIHSQVAQDYQTQVAAMLAQRYGSNFVSTLNLKLITGRTFASACVSAGLAPEELPPFSLSTRDLPALENRVGFPQVKQAAFGTPVGRASNFETTDDGGFVIFVQKQLPPDEIAMKTDMPQYIDQVRRERAFEIFQSWVSQEASRELRNIPALAKLTAPGAR